MLKANLKKEKAIRIEENHNQSQRKLISQSWDVIIARNLGILDKNVLKEWSSIMKKGTKNGDVFVTSY